jgi:hypothetical protein
MSQAETIERDPNALKYSLFAVLPLLHSSMSSAKVESIAMNADDVSETVTGSQKSKKFPPKRFVQFANACLGNWLPLAFSPQSRISHELHASLSNVIAHEVLKRFSIRQIVPFTPETYSKHCRLSPVALPSVSNS